MSVHDRKRIHPHKHFQYEVIQAPLVRPYRPAYRGVHSSDVVIDSVLTLNLIGAEFLRHWEAEDAETKDAEWVEVSDASASKGKALKILSTDPNDKQIKFVDSVDLGIAGELNLLVRLKVANNASSNNVCEIGIWDEDGSAWLNYRTIKPNEFPSSNVYHHFAVKVEVPEDKNNLTVVCKFKGNGVTNLWCDFGGFVPANVPLDFADVDITDDDAIVTIGTMSSDQTIIGIVPTVYNTVVVADTWTDVVTVYPSVDTEAYYAFINARTNDATSYKIRHRLYDVTAGKYYPTTYGVEGRASTTMQAAALLIATANVNGHTLKIQTKCISGALTVSSTVTRWQHAQHTHDHEEYSPQHGQSGGSDLGHDH